MAEIRGAVRPSGRIKAYPEDFAVDEIPAYAPSGAGDHLFVRFTKTDCTTMEAVQRIARALGCDPRQAGFAGMKDKRAVATQTISLQTPRGVRAAELAARACALSFDDIVIREAVPHTNKLKPGHLAGNRFTLVVRDVPLAGIPEVAAAFTRMARDGVPNAFGAQRFGVAGDNAARALAWLRGQERGPRDPRALRLLWSSLQSAIFNTVLAERVRAGTWATPLAGDLLKLRASGGLFVCSDVQTDRERALAGDLSPTGPMFGVHMRAAEGAPGELERRICEETIGPDVDLTRTRALGEGSRRPLRIWVENLVWELAAEARGPREPSGKSESRVDCGKGTACVRVDFVLPKGAYATTVLSNALTIHESQAENPALEGDDETTKTDNTHSEPDENER